MEESTVAVAMADVMMYDDATKQWLSPDGSNEAARSQVRILHNIHANTFRIVGTRLQDGNWILNCNIYDRLRYKPATPTFHQWRDEKRKVYGLSFTKEEDARLFVKVMTQALSILTSSNDYQNGSDLGFSNTIYQEPHQLHHNAYSSPSFRSADDETLCSGGGLPAQNMNNFRKSSQSVQSSTSGTGTATTMMVYNVQRRASQGSSSSSNGSSLPPVIYASTSANNNCPASTSIRPAPATSLASNYNSTPSLSINSANVATISSNAPPAPPPPPPPSSLSLGKGISTSIADQLKKIQLRKVSAPSSNSAAPGSSNLLSELEATLSKRKNQCDNSDSRSIGSDTASSTNAVGNGTSRRPWEKQVNGTANITDSPKINRKLSSSNSLNQEESRSTGHASAITVETLEKCKEEILNEIRQEISKAKDEIIEALRSELFLQRR
ncbi:Protein enabled [Dirofilaria immitis]